jgi:hypothetical protein
MMTPADANAQSETATAEAQRLYAGETAGVPSAQHEPLSPYDVPPLTLPNQPQAVHPQANPLGMLAAGIFGLVDPAAAGQFANASGQGSIEAAQRQTEQGQQAYENLFHSVMVKHQDAIQREDAKHKIEYENNQNRYEDSIEKNRKTMQDALERRNTGITGGQAKADTDLAASEKKARPSVLKAQTLQSEYEQELKDRLPALKDMADIIKNRDDRISITAGGIGHDKAHIAAASADKEAARELSLMMENMRLGGEWGREQYRMTHVPASVQAQIQAGKEKQKVSLDHAQKVRKAKSPDAIDKKAAADPDTAPLLRTRQLADKRYLTALDGYDKGTVSQEAYTHAKNFKAESDDAYNKLVAKKIASREWRMDDVPGKSSKQFNKSPSPQSFEDWVKGMKKSQ